MRTCIDVINRIKWDLIYPPEECLIGYRNFSYIVEIKLLNWVPQTEGGDIPSHRIHYIKHGDLVIWHREKKIDLVFHSGSNEELVIEKGLKSFANIPLKPLMRTEGSWESVDQVICNNEIENFSIISWNVLASHLQNDSDENIRERYIEIVNLLQQYDVVCLQEATRTFLDILDETDWVSEYWISDFQGNTFENDMGVVILSRIPCKRVYMLCDTKNTVITEFLICSQNIKVVNLHLTSDFHAKNKERRQKLLNRIHNITKSDSNAIWMIVGDFNCGYKQISDIASWLKEYEHAVKGSTFVPSKNPLCANSTQGDRQIDHLFIKESMVWHLLDYDILELDYSDHYPITAKLELYCKTTSSDTCIVTVPPLKYWHLLLGESKKINKKWMPHLSILLGYYEKDSKKFDLDFIKESFQPFYLVLDRHDRFQKRDVIATDNREIRELEHRLRQSCPTATRHLFEGEYNPHISLSKHCDNPREINRLEWRVDKIFVDVKDGLYFEHLYTIDKGEDKFDPDEFVESISRLFHQVKFQIIGSRLYLDDKTSDLDIIAYGTREPSEFYETALWICKSCGEFETCYITDSKIKIIKLVNKTIGHVDLQYIQCSESQFGVSPLEWRVEYSTIDSSIKSQTLVLQDNLYYKATLTSEQISVINQIKRWAKARRIYFNAVGYYSGITITTMVVYSGCKSLKEFVDFYRDFDYANNIIGDSRFRKVIKREKPVDKMIYISSYVHPFNLNVKVTKSSLYLINRELNNFSQEVVRLEDIGYPAVYFNISDLGIIEYGRLTGKIAKLIVSLETEFSLYVHVIVEDNIFYLFLIKIKDSNIDSIQLFRYIREWFLDNKFYLQLKIRRKP